ncbi:MAG: hypothetical protein BM556_14380 [Bacteriovorax sp. MedPE-SWde]|nr:MAG: hypothetical protein BM556_14380 [Bacteriovorax sp. MedPE-SWde]
MAGIGRPQQANPFSKISMAPASAKKKGQDLTVGEQLNKIAGSEEEKQFVDRKEHNKLGKDGFLKLLSHQLSNQDPMKPMDQKQFAADLAQFSQLEQLTNMNKKMDGLSTNAPQETKFYGASFLGKEIMTNGSTISYDGQEVKTDIPFFLDKAAKNVVVNITDSKKQLIAQIEAEDLGRGQQKINWNGKQLDGIRAVKDNYTIEVRAFDKDMNSFKAETKSKGVVSGVNFVNGETVLTLSNGKEIYLRDVDSFALPKNKQNDAMKQNVQGLKKKAASQYNNINEQM